MYTLEVSFELHTSVDLAHPWEEVLSSDGKPSELTFIQHS